jgi:hypothetical protein
MGFLLVDHHQREKASSKGTSSHKKTLIRKILLQYRRKEAPKIGAFQQSRAGRVFDAEL